MEMSFIEDWCQDMVYFARKAARLRELTASSELTAAVERIAAFCEAECCQLAATLATAAVTGSFLADMDSVGGEPAEETTMTSETSTPSLRRQSGGHSESGGSSARHEARGQLVLPSLILSSCLNSCSFCM
jgi:hypothetical protein